MALIAGLISFLIVAVVLYIIFLIGAKVLGLFGFPADAIQILKLICGLFLFLYFVQLLGFGGTTFPVVRLPYN